MQDSCTGKQIGLCLGSRDLYCLHTLDLPHCSTSTVALASSAASFPLWHNHLGHLPLNKKKLLVSCGCLGNISVTNNSDCFGCRFGKQHALPYNKSSPITHAPFDLVHSDIWGHVSQPTNGGSFYYVPFIDDFTCYT